MGTGVLKVYERADLAPRKGRQILGRLAAKGLVVIHTFAGKGRGGRLRVIQVTDKGWHELRKLGIERPKPLTGGGWEHELAARLIAHEGRRQGYQVEYEVTMEDRRFDVVWTSKAGQKVFHEVELSDILHAVENLLKALEIPGVTMFGNKLVLVVRDKKDAERAAKILRKKGRRLEEDGVISIRCISDYFINI